MRACTALLFSRTTCCALHDWSGSWKIIAKSPHRRVATPHHRSNPHQSSIRGSSSGQPAWLTNWRTIITQLTKGSWSTSWSKPSPVFKCLSKNICEGCLKIVTGCAPVVTSIIHRHSAFDDFLRSVGQTRRWDKGWTFSSDKKGDLHFWVEWRR